MRVKSDIYKFLLKSVINFKFVYDFGYLLVGSRCSIVQVLAMSWVRYISMQFVNSYKSHIQEIYYTLDLFVFSLSLRVSHNFFILSSSHLKTL